MASLLLPYSTQLFNDLPDLHTAQQIFLSRGGMKMIDHLFMPIIEKHGLEAQLGVGLVHRHFDLRDDEKLVEFNSISIPWANQQGDDYSGGEIIPHAWAIHQGKLFPYEFYFSPLGKDAPFDFGAISNFLSDFMQAIEENALEKCISLRLLPYEGFTGALEFTNGRANINLTPTQVPEDGWDGTTETTWFFESEYPKQKRVCRCLGPPNHMHYQCQF